MHEFLIRGSDGGAFFWPYKDYPQILKPLTISFSPVAGWGSHRIEVEREEISFSDEDLGLRVSFETGLLSHSRAREIVDDICRNIEATTGESTRVVEL